MSWISDGLAGIGRSGWGAVRDYANLVSNPVSNKISEFASGMYNQMDLRGAELESILSGFPILGNFIKGVNGVQQIEDLYNNTGKVPAYPGSSTGGNAGGIGKGVGQLTRKIEGGVNDLFEFYTGEKDTTIDGDLYEKWLHDNGYFQYGDEL